jgi:hypothetical protein
VELNSYITGTLETGNLRVLFAADGSIQAGKYGMMPNRIQKNSQAAKQT